MGHFRSSRFSRIAVVASGAMLLFGGSALAQTVTMFDDTPTIEQLRSIMVPESRPGMSRSIVIQRPDTSAPQAVVQHAPAPVAPAPRTPVATEDLQPAPAAPVDTAAAEEPQPDQVAGPTAAAKPGSVGFRINFAFDSAALPDSAHSKMAIVAQLMKEMPQIKVRIEGHTDAVGSVNYNLSLSERRALSVGEYLVKLGIDPSRLMPAGKGMSDPLPATNPYDPSNRRVQFVRVG